MKVKLGAQTLSSVVGLPMELSICVKKSNLLLKIVKLQCILRQIDRLFDILNLEYHFLKDIIVLYMLVTLKLYSLFSMILGTDYLKTLKCDESPFIL